MQCLQDNESAKIIIQAGIKEVIYCSYKMVDDTALRASKILFKMAGVKLKQYSPKFPHLILDFGKSDLEGRSFDTSPKQDKKTDAKLEFRDLLINEAGYDPLKTDVVNKRKGYLSWDDYFLSVAFLTSQRSKDPNTQVGAVIVDTNNCITGIGYNGFPRGCSDDYLPWARTGSSDLHKKYPYVVHAEANAILNKGSKDVKGGILYVALFPCNDCAKLIIQSGIKEIVYMRDVYHDSDQCRASRILLKMAGVKLRHHQPSSQLVTLNLRCE